MEGKLGREKGTRAKRRQKGNLAEEFDFQIQIKIVDSKQRS
jgi:hypothetical protein